MDSQGPQSRSSNDSSIPKASKNSSPLHSSNPTHSLSLSLNISSSSFSKDKDSDIPYRSGWVRKFKQPKEAHSYVPSFDSSALYSTFKVKRSLEHLSPVVQQNDDMNEVEAMSNLHLNDSGSSDDITKSPLKSDVDATNKQVMTNLSSSLEGIGAIRSPWGENIIIDYGGEHELEDEVSNSKSSLSVEMDELLSAPKSNGDVSSLTNRSSQRSFISSQTDGPNETLLSQSPTLQHLEYLASHSAAAQVTKFSYHPQLKHSHIEIGRSPNHISLKDLKEIYGCHSRKEAMKLALHQSNCLSQASANLVDLLFEYLRKCCGVQNRRLFLNYGNDYEIEPCNSDQIIPYTPKGLSLPASAVGWLSAYLLPTEADKEYQQLWLESNSEAERAQLPNASPSLGLQNKFGLLRDLLAKHVTHLRITNTAWPGNVNEHHRKKGDAHHAADNTPRRRGKMLLNFDSETTYSFLAFHRHLQNRPRIDMALFPNTQFLQLVGIPGEWLVNLNHARLSLERLSIQRGYISSCSSIFHSNDDTIEMNRDQSNFDEKDAISGPKLSPSSKFLGIFHTQYPCFSNLSHLSLTYCGLDDHSTDTMVSSWLSLSRLKTLDLSHNAFCDPKYALRGIDVLTVLSGIDLSHNRICSMSGMHMILGNVNVILLSHNKISNVSGLDKLHSLQRLDLSNNRIKKLVDVASVGKLPDLMYLTLIGNPIALSRKRLYRCKIFNIFKDTRLTMSDKQLQFSDLENLLPQLDGASLTIRDFKTLEYLSFNQSFEIDKNMTDSQGIILDSSSRAPSSTSPDSGVMHPDSNKKLLQRILRSTPRCTAVIENEELLTVKMPRDKIRRVKLVKNPIIVLPYSSESFVVPDVSLSMEKVVNYINPGVLIESESLECNSDCCESQVLDSLLSSDENEHYFSDDDNQITSSETAVISFRDPKAVESSIDTPSIVDFSIVDPQPDSSVLMDIEKSAAIGMKLDPKLEEASEGYDILMHTDIGNIDAFSEQTQKDVLDRYDFATLERTSKYDGPGSYSDLFVNNYCELYFRSFVFPTQLHDESVDLYEGNHRNELLPRIQLYQSDRDLMIWSATYNKELNGLNSNIFDQANEQFITVSKESVLACGMAATGRITLNNVNVKGFRGKVLLKESGKPHTFSESRTLLLCISNVAVYLIPDFDNAINRGRFPSPIASGATFKDAYWPHAYCRHPLKYLRKISFNGYGFQRLALHFKLPALRAEMLLQPDNAIMSNFDYSYVIFTRDQKRTIQLLQMIQQAAKGVSPNETLDSTLQPSSIIVENDDNCLLDAIGRALGRSQFTDGILHYQILYQIWPDNSISGARRCIVLTENELFLFHETYAGDFSSGTFEFDTSTTTACGDVSMRTIASTELQDICTVSISRENPREVYISVKSQSRLMKPSNWYLLCQDHINAERLTNDVLKACEVK